MQVVQHHPHHHAVPIRSDQPTSHWQTEATSPIDQPLTFSIDDHLSTQHLTQLDLCSKNLTRIDKLPNNIHFNVVLLDYNDITKLEHLDVLTQLIQLSISHNRLIDIRILSRLRTLQKLNLSENSIDSIDCLKTLQNLVILNIAGNNIQNLGALNACHSLQSINASDNSIRQIEDLSHLTSLKYLNLHKNLIDTLISAPKHWPKSLHTLILSDNEIKDLTEIYYLSSFIDLNTFYIDDNPCSFIVDDRHGCYQPFDYRPYVLNWCLTIQNLDGIFITRKESLKAEWLLSQGKGRAFRPGDHEDLVNYLTKVCGTDAEERDDLHLSRIMLQQDLYSQHKQNDDEEMFMRTSDTMKDANDTISKDIQIKLQQSLLISESEFVKLSPSSSVSTVGEPVTDNHHSERLMRTPSPGYIRPTSVTTNYNDDQITEHSSSNRYSAYDNRPIKPLNQNMLQSKLNQYPIENHSNNLTRPNDDTNISRPRAVTNPQKPKRTSTHLAYNANRYSPKTTTREPTTATVMRTKPNKNLSTQQQAKRHTVAAGNVDILNHPTHRTTAALKIKHKQQHSSKENKNLTDDDDELQLKSAPINAMVSTQSTTRLKTAVNDGELKRLTTSIETIRTSVLQAYLDLHGRFTRTTELQTSALSALWKMFETQNLTHQREIGKITEENRLLYQRIRDLENRLNPNERKSSILHPPLRVHISKRDAKSFFLHWIPNPLNDQCTTILGYRIYIDEVFKATVDTGKFDAIIDYIREEGEYKIKVRTYDQNGESEDSNIVIARFRRQQSVTPIHRTLSDHMVENTNQTNIVHVPLRQTQSQDDMVISPRDEIKQPIIMNKQRERMDVNQSVSSGGIHFLKQQQNEAQTTPDKKTDTSDELNSPVTSSSPHTNHINSGDNIIYRKPPRSPSSSPSRSEKTTTTTDGSCNKVLFANNYTESTVTTKRSPTRTGIMSRLAKSPHKMKRNNVLLNALPINLTPSPAEPANTTKPEVNSDDRTIHFQHELSNSYDHGHYLAQPIPITSSSMPIYQSPPRLSRSQNPLMNSLDQNY